MAVAWRWGPVVAWAALIFALSSVPDLGTGLGGGDFVVRKIAHAAEFTVLGFLLVRALGHVWASLVIGIGYAVSDEVHQHFVSGRVGSAVDVVIDAVGVVVGVFLARRMRHYHWIRGTAEGRR